MTHPLGRLWPRVLVVLILLLLPSCRDRVVGPEPLTPDEEKPRFTPLGIVEITIKVDGDQVSASASDNGGPNPVLVPITGGDGTIQLETVSSGSFTEGSRAIDGQRYFTSTFRVRNAQSNGTAYGTARNNLTFIGVRTASGLSNSSVTGVRKFDGTAASAALAAQVTPTGAVVLDDSAKMKSNVPDVLQIFTEAEVAAITKPAGVLDIFPWGFVARNPNTPNSRTLPANPLPNQWDGLVTFSFRVPLQPAGVAQDAYSVSFTFLTMDDTETRVTESIEEQDTTSSRRLRERATALGATMTTVLNGSPAMDPFVTDYPGQRQVCGPRIAGVVGSPTRTINADGAYIRIAQYYPGEVVDACAADFRSGTPSRPALGVPFELAFRAMDRYGNVRTTSPDTINLSLTDPAGTVNSPPTALVSGAATMSVTYQSYGAVTAKAVGRRRAGYRTLTVIGSTRTWTGTTNTLWATSTNWNPVGSAPGVQDTVIIPGDRPNYPLLVQNTAIGGVTMTPGGSVQPTINLSSFDFTVGADLAQGTTGTTTGTGRIVLAGTSNTIGGGLSNVDMRNMRVTGRYSATSNLNVTGGRIVVQGGRLRSQGYRIRVRPS